MSSFRIDESILGPYWYASGRFLYHFARVEHTMGFTLRRVARVSPGVGRAIFSGTRVRTGIDHIRRIYEERQLKLPLYIDEAFAILGTLNTSRDLLLHYGLWLEKPNLAVIDTSYRTVKTRSKKIALTVQDIDDMNNDLIVAWARLLIFNFEHSRARSFPHEAGWREAAQRPLRYKPPAPIRAKSTPHVAKRRPSPQPQSSEG